MSAGIDEKKLMSVKGIVKSIGPYGVVDDSHHLIWTHTITMNSSMGVVIPHASEGLTDKKCQDMVEMSYLGDCAGENLSSIQDPKGVTSPGGDDFVDSH